MNQTLDDGPDVEVDVVPDPIFSPGHLEVPVEPRIVGECLVCGAVGTLTASTHKARYGHWPVLGGGLRDAGDTTST